MSSQLTFYITEENREKLGELKEKFGGKNTSKLLGNLIDEEYKKMKKYKNL